MAKKPDGQPNNGEKPAAQTNWRWYWIRTVLVTVLMFVFIVYVMRESGPIAYLWAGILSLATLGYFVFSYYKLRD